VEHDAGQEAVAQHVPRFHLREKNDRREVDLVGPSSEVLVSSPSR